jgi:hypothetical protein
MTMARWFAERKGYLIGPLELSLGENPINIVEEDMDAVSNGATAITQIAGGFCRVDDQW